MPKPVAAGATAESVKQLPLFSLPLYGPATEPLKFDDCWNLNSDDLYIAILLECGPPPGNEHVTQAVQTAWYWRARTAMEKYFKHSCQMPFDIVAQSALYDFVNWVNAQR